MHRFERTHLREFTFGLVSATHVLKGEDEFAAGVIPHGVFGIRISIRAIRANAVRRAGDPNGIVGIEVFGRIDGSE